MSEIAEVIMKNLKAEQMTEMELGERVDKPRQLVNQYIHRNQDIKFGVVEEMLNAMGYGIQIIKQPWILVSKKYFEERVFPEGRNGLYLIEGKEVFSVGIVENGVEGKVVTVLDDFHSREECISFLNGRTVQKHTNEMEEEMED